MNPLKTILRLVVSCLFWILITFWVVFVINTIFYYVESGPDRVVHWYMHISRAGIQSHWSWRAFLTRQMAILAITVALYFSKRRLRNWARGPDDKS